MTHRETGSFNGSSTLGLSRMEDSRLAVARTMAQESVLHRRRRVVGCLLSDLSKQVVQRVVLGGRRSGKAGKAGLGSLSGNRLLLLSVHVFVKAGKTGLGRRQTLGGQLARDLVRRHCLHLDHLLHLLHLLHLGLLLLLLHLELFHLRKLLDLRHVGLLLLLLVKLVLQLLLFQLLLLLKLLLNLLLVLLLLHLELFHLRKLLQLRGLLSLLGLVGLLSGLQLVQLVHQRKLRQLLVLHWRVVAWGELS